MAIEFTDQELGIINAVLIKSDPVGLISEAQSALAKIRAYAERKAQEQVAQAAETPPKD